MYDEIYTAYFKIVCFLSCVEGIYDQEERGGVGGICTNKTDLQLSYYTGQFPRQNGLMVMKKTICNNKLEETSLFTIY